MWPILRNPPFSVLQNGNFLPPLNIAPADGKWQYSAVSYDSTQLNILQILFRQSSGKECMGLSYYIVVQILQLPVPVFPLGYEKHIPRQLHCKFAQGNAQN